MQAQPGPVASLGEGALAAGGLSRLEGSPEGS